MFVEIYRPLDFDSNRAFPLGGENVGSPFLASGHDTCHIGLCRPAMGASRHNRHLLQVEMFFGFRGCSACPNSLMGKNRVPRRDRFSVTCAEQHGILRWREVLFSSSRACHSSSGRSKEWMLWPVGSRQRIGIVSPCTYARTLLRSIVRQGGLPCLPSL